MSGKPTDRWLLSPQEAADLTPIAAAVATGAIRLVHPDVETFREYLRELLHRTIRAAYDPDCDDCGAGWWQTCTEHASRAVADLAIEALEGDE